MYYILLSSRQSHILHTGLRFLLFFLFKQLFHWKRFTQPLTNRTKSDFDSLFFFSSIFIWFLADSLTYMVCCSHIRLPVPLQCRVNLSKRNHSITMNVMPLNIRWQFLFELMMHVIDNNFIYIFHSISCLCPIFIAFDCSSTRTRSFEKKKKIIIFFIAFVKNPCKVQFRNGISISFHSNSQIESSQL